MDGTTNVVITIVAAVISSGGATAFVNYLLNKSGKNNPVYVGLRLILQDRIEWIGMKAIEKECITYSQRKILNAMHDCYHNGLHGNGDLDDLMETVNELEVIYPNKKEQGGK